MTISEARPDDLAGIVALETLGFEAGEQWSETAWATELTATDRHVVCWFVDGRISGVATLRCVADVVDLNRVIVHPDARGQGIGAALVRAGLDWAGAVGAQRMLLEVKPANEPAVALYRRLGFEPLTTRPDYYGPGHHALVMQRPLFDGDAGAVERA